MSTLSYAGQNNKWNNAEDAKKVAEDIRNAQNLECLILEGNTLGIDAAKEIGDALKTQHSFQRAHWKDLFTGRLKNEIPQALKHLFGGVQHSGAKLKELDLSDNALGPLGVEGITDFLKSTSCHSLEELRLNNNGLGIKGGTMLAESLMELHSSCEAAGTPLKLKVLIAGRNRLENEGAKILAEFFGRVKSLEELSMPQNGIFHQGIVALAIALSKNANLRILNLNDNTITHKGAKALAKYLPEIPKLEVINFGDCLLRTNGATEIAESVRDSHPYLKELHLDSNEIKTDGGLLLVDSILNKNNFTQLVINGNQFGECGCEEIISRLKHFGKESVLGSMEDDEGSDYSEDEEDTNEEEEEDDDDVEEVSSSVGTKVKMECTVDQFISDPSAENLLGLREPFVALIEAAKRNCQSLGRDDSEGSPGSEEAFVFECLVLLFKCSSLLTNNDRKVVEMSEKCVHELGKAAFKSALDSNIESVVTNNLLVNFGLIKSENKKFKIQRNLKGGLMGLSILLSEKYFFSETKDTLQFFFSKPSSIDQYGEQKHLVMKKLFQ